MVVVEITSDNQVDFLRAIAQAQPRDRIVYHKGATCHASPLRLWALGASDAGLVILAKIRVKPGDTAFEHIAIRTKKKFRAFKRALPNPTY